MDERNKRDDFYSVSPGEGVRMAKLTPMKAIRKKCLDCCCGSSNEVLLCPAIKCPLWTYRSGHRPKTDILSTEEEETLNPIATNGVNNKSEDLQKEVEE